MPEELCGRRSLFLSVRYRFVSRASFPHSRRVWVQCILRTCGHQSGSDTLIPTLRCKTVIDSLHRDAVGHRANERAEVAAHALVFIDAWDTREWREIWAVGTETVEVEFWDGCCRDAARSFRGNALRCALCVRLRQGAIEMNALMCAVPAGGVAELAADALLLVDARDDLVVEVEVLPIGDVGERAAAKVVEGAEAFAAHPGEETSSHVFDDAIAVV